ncbi:sensor histidine kinase [Pseudonocardia spinosispora]|uniref:sensor histidine kinase n=1 Tax=Pseudonocardia spinosispora TaxID=103441 RepID=UPI000424DEEE|nr:nitrate- and nitrite sensing domain-containing protein [Pseudonocardia spinosispora]
MSSEVTARPSLQTRLRPENWSVPLKLTAVLLVPILLALALGALRIADQIRNADDLAARDRYIGLQSQVAKLVDELQTERDASSVFVAGNRVGDSAALKKTFGVVDGAWADVQSAIGDPDTLAGGSQVAFGQVKGNFDGLSQLRGQVTGTGSDTAGVIARYTGVIEPLTVLEASLDRELNTPALAGLSAGLTAMTSAREQVALEHTVVGAAIGRGEMLPVDADTVRATDARLGTAIDQFRAGLDADQQRRYAGFATSPATKKFQQLKQTALSRVGARGQLGLSAADWDGAYKAVTSEMRTSEDGIRDEITSTSADQQQAARNAAGVNSVILLLAMLAAAAVVFLVGRSLLRPLRVLRSTALEVAETRLPRALEAMRAGKIPDAKIKPVAVRSTEEIGQVARAFDEVHGQAVRLAAEQATLQNNVSNMFVNLSRRSQTLVERQLQLIERLERNEQDAEQLANLFQLDHLATRMRRNSENLLVLAGSELAKRGSQPVPVVDVLRAAVSEIEQYRRVVVQQPPGVELAGRAASDVVHLVAELLDNATNFSPPDTQVVVGCTRTSNGTLLIEIADQGVGMPGDELAALNARLAGDADMDVSASRRMGLFVVGRLASRHGIGVRLSSSQREQAENAGVTVAVTVPDALIIGDAEQDPRRQQQPETPAVTRAAVDDPTLVGIGGAAGVVNGATNGAVNGAVNGAARTAVNGSGGLPQRAVGAALGGDRPSGAPGRQPGGLPLRGPAIPGEPGGQRPGNNGAGRNGHAIREPESGDAEAPSVERTAAALFATGGGAEAADEASADAAPRERNAEPRAQVRPEAPPARRPARDGAGPRQNRGPGNGQAGPGPNGPARGEGRPGRNPIESRPERGAPGARPERPIPSDAQAATPAAAEARPERRPDTPPAERPVAGPDRPERPARGERPERRPDTPPVDGPARPERPARAERPERAPERRPVPPPVRGSDEQHGPIEEKIEQAEQPNVDEMWDANTPAVEEEEARRMPDGPPSSPQRTRAGSAPARPDRVEGPARPERSIGPERAAAPERPVRPEDAKHSARAERPEQVERARRPEGPVRPEGPPRPAGPGRPVQDDRARRADGPARPDQRKRPERPGRPDGKGRPEREPGELTIFEETSAWFRDNWQLEPDMRLANRGAEVRPRRPIEQPAAPAEAIEQFGAGSGAGAPAAAAAPEAVEQEKVEAEKPEQATEQQQNGGDSLSELDGWLPGGPRRPEAEAGAEQPAENWTGNDELLRPMPETASTELTSAGLPKRRPRSQLIPGGPSDGGAAAVGPVPARSAEQVRGRLASYQSGVRQGRESRLRRLAEVNARVANDENNGPDSHDGKENG